MLITCKANNKHNYTIAFEEPIMGVSEEFHNSEAMSTGESRNTGSGEAWSSDGSVPAVSAPMISSDTTFTTWNKLKKCTTSATTNCTQQLKEVLVLILVYSINLAKLNYANMKINFLSFIY